MIIYRVISYESFAYFVTKKEHKLSPVPSTGMLENKVNYYLKEESVSNLSTSY